MPAHRKVATTVLFAIAKPQPGASAQGGGGGNERASPLAAQLEEEQAQHHDIVLLDAPEGYEHLWRKALVFFQWLASSGRRLPDYVMHADDDSFLRLDLLLPLLDAWPRTRHYWGYIWDQSTPARSTAPIRNPANKSHMPSHQVSSCLKDGQTITPTHAHRYHALGHQLLPPLLLLLPPLLLPRQQHSLSVMHVLTPHGPRPRSFALTLTLDLCCVACRAAVFVAVPTG